MGAISFRCDSCGRTLRVAEDKAGRRARCPDCRQILTIPEAAQSYSVEAPASPPPSPSPARATAEEADKRKLRRRPRGQRAAWRKVLLGLSLVVICMGLTLLTLIASLVAGLFGGERVLAVLRFIGFGWQALGLVGYGFCLAVPPKNHARSFAMATLLLACAGFLFDVGSVLVPREPAQARAVEERVDLDLEEGVGDEAPMPLAAVVLNALKTLLVDYGRHFTFLFFLWAVALMYEGNDLVRDATQLLVFEGIAFAWWAVTGLLSLVGADQAVNAIGALVGLDFLCGLAGGLLNVATLILFLRLLYNTLLVLQSKAEGKPFYTEEDREALRHLPIERRVDLH
jgi:DNA-directed RNA polymerase subunit RPC12/RpoP